MAGELLGGHDFLWYALEPLPRFDIVRGLDTGAFAVPLQVLAIPRPLGYIVYWKDASHWALGVSLGVYPGGFFAPFTAILGRG